MSKRRIRSSQREFGNASGIPKKSRIGERVENATSAAMKSPYFTAKAHAVDPSDPCSGASLVSKKPSDDDTPKPGRKLIQKPVSNNRPGKKDTTLIASPTPPPLSSGVVPASSKRLSRAFYDCPGEDLARALLGKLVVRELAGGTRVSGRIVETEAYLGKMDKAAHSFKKKTDRNAAMFMEPGTAYVYNIYGMYCCMNISSQGEGCAVLLRALEPEEGVEGMAGARQPRPGKDPKPGKDSKPKTFKKENLCDGPSKLCQALRITKNTINAQDLTTSQDIWLEDGDPIDQASVVVTKRINIGYAEEWVDKPLRFYILDSKFVSKPRDKEAEKLLRDKA